MTTKRRLGGLIGLAFAAAFALSHAFGQSPGGQAPGDGAARILDIRLGVKGGETRIVLDLDRPARHRAFALADPPRIVVDVTGARAAVAAGRGARGRGLVKRFRVGAFRDGVARAVFDVRRPARIVRSFSIPARDGKGPRAVIDIARYRPPQTATPAQPTVPARPSTPPRPTRKAPDGATPKPRPALALAVPPPSAAPATETPSQAEPSPAPETAPPAIAETPDEPAPVITAAPPPRRTKRVIVIDPGHGGVDPGAVSASKRLEKDIVLVMALELAEALEATGRYEARLTRTEDVFVSLRDRVAKARDAKADLFLSLHADSLPQDYVRGIALFTLSEKASDREAAALAAKENRVDVIAGVDLDAANDDVASILIDLAQRETKERSLAYAYALAKRLRPVTPLLKKTHKSAGFRVLKAPDVPSVLIELGFLSNAEDEEQMLSAPWRRRIAREIIAAIDDWFAN